MFTTFRLAPPQGYNATYIDLLPRLNYNADWDLGDGGLLRRSFLENPLVPGGVLTTESAGIRRMSVPVVLASSASYSLADLERNVRRAIRPGAWLEYQGHGASTLMRIDIAGGDLVYERFSPRVAQVGRRPAMLRLDVQPFAYPASGMILLASTASVALPGNVGLATSMGDMPGYLRIILAATAGATRYPPGVWNMDAVAWAVTNNAAVSLEAQNGMATAVTLGGPTSVSSYDQFAPPVGGAGGTTTNARIFPQAASGWRPALTWLSGWDPRTENFGIYKAGRYRAYAWARLGPSQALPWMLSFDCVPNLLQAMASAAPIATLAPAVASGTPGAWGAQPSPAYQLIDLGEVTVPPALPSGYDGLPSGQSLDYHFRLWAGAATNSVGVSTPILDIGGAWLQHLDLSSGVLQRGLAQPTHSVAGVATGSIKTGRLYLDGRPNRRSILITHGGASPGILHRNEPLGDALQNYRGDVPALIPHNFVGAPQNLSLISGARSAASGATGPIVHAGPIYAAVSVEYSPQFVFLPFPEVI